MAGHLIDAGHTLFIYDVVKVPAELTDKGATAVASSAEVAKNADVIILMVPDTRTWTRRCSAPAALRKASAPARSWWT